MKEKRLFYINIIITLITFFISIQMAEARECKKGKLTLGNPTFQVEVSKVGDASESLKSILIMPPTGGTNYIDHSYARKLCRSGFDVYILDHWTNDDEYSLDLDIHQRFYRRGQDAIKIVLKEIKSPFIGLLGTSVGAEHAAVAASNFKEIDSIFIILGGAPISKILAESSQEILVNGRKKRFSLYGFQSLGEYMAALDDALSWEPFKMDRLFINKDLGMIISKNDDVVPSKYQEKLRDLWKPKTVIRLSAGHFFSIIQAWIFYSQNIIDHFNKGALLKLNQDGA